MESQLVNKFHKLKPEIILSYIRESILSNTYMQVFYLCNLIMKCHCTVCCRHKFLPCLSIQSHLQAVLSIVLTEPALQFSALLINVRQFLWWQLSFLHMDIEDIELMK